MSEYITITKETPVEVDVCIDEVLAEGTSLDFEVRENLYGDFTVYVQLDVNIAKEFLESRGYVVTEL